jgi:hypothetical protein
MKAYTYRTRDKVVVVVARTTLEAVPKLESHIGPVDSFRIITLDENAALEIFFDTEDAKRGAVTRTHRKKEPDKQEAVLWDHLKEG